MGFWLIGKRAFLKWDPDLVYVTLRLVPLMYMLPVAFIAVNLTLEEGYIQTDHMWQLNFSVAGLMESAFFIAGVIWLGFTLRNIRDHRRRSGGWRRACRESAIIGEERIQREFKRICRKLHIRRKVRLYWNDAIASPMASGIICPRVMLPCRDYTREQLAVIFYHELTHYKDRDVLCKLCCFCVSVLGHLDFFSNQLLANLNEWSEYYCDARATEAMSDEFTPKEYFEIIIDIMSETPDPHKERYIFSTLYEGRHSLERRIDYMKRYRKAAKRAKGITFLIAAVFVMMSVSTAYAAGSGLAAINDEIFKSTEVIDVVSSLEDGQEIVYIPAGEDADCGTVYEPAQEDGIMKIIDANEIVSFSWTVTPGTRHVSDRIRLKAGQTIEASCVATPSDQIYWLGLMDPHNNSKCVEGTGAMSHSFTVSETGYYRVMVQNRGTQDITASGSFYYH